MVWCSKYDQGSGRIKCGSFDKTVYRRVFRNSWRWRSEQVDGNWDWIAHPVLDYLVSKVNQKKVFIVSNKAIDIEWKHTQVFPKLTKYFVSEKLRARGSSLIFNISARDGICVNKISESRWLHCSRLTSFSLESGDGKLLGGDWRVHAVMLSHVWDTRSAGSAGGPTVQISIFFTLNDLHSYISWFLHD